MEVKLGSFLNNHENCRCSMELKLFDTTSLDQRKSGLIVRGIELRMDAQSIHSLYIYMVKFRVICCFCYPFPSIARAIVIMFFYFLGDLCGHFFLMHLVICLIGLAIILLIFKIKIYNKGTRPKPLLTLGKYIKCLVHVLLNNT